MEFQPLQSRSRSEIEVCISTRISCTSLVPLAFTSNTDTVSPASHRCCSRRRDARIKVLSS